jgi:hypothetical protein
MGRGATAAMSRRAPRDEKPAGGKCRCRARDEKPAGGKRRRDGGRSPRGGRRGPRPATWSLSTGQRPVTVCRPHWSHAKVLAPRGPRGPGWVGRGRGAAAHACTPPCAAAAPSGASGASALPPGAAAAASASCRCRGAGAPPPPPPPLLLRCAAGAGAGGSIACRRAVCWRTSSSGPRAPKTSSIADTRCLQAQRTGGTRQ